MFSKLAYIVYVCSTPTTMSAMARLMKKTTSNVIENDLPHTSENQGFVQIVLKQGKAKEQRLKQMHD
jgi:hypothetical protein